MKSQTSDMNEDINIVIPHKICPPIETANGWITSDKYKPSLMVSPIQNIIRGKAIAVD